MDELQIDLLIFPMVYDEHVYCPKTNLGTEVINNNLALTSIVLK